VTQAPPEAVADALAVVPPASDLAARLAERARALGERVLEEHDAGAPIWRRAVHPGPARP